MEKVVPVLPMDDSDQAKAFYLSKLGFELLFEWRHEPGFPLYMGIQKGDIFLHLSEHSKGHPGSEIYIFVDDIQTWADSLTSKGVPIESGPQKMPWGNTDMALKDPNGNLLRISQQGTHEPTAESA